VAEEELMNEGRDDAGAREGAAAVDQGEGASVLLVDDHEENLIALEATLEPLGLRLVKAQSGALALKALLREAFAVILLDVTMPEMDGFETAAIIKQRDRTRHTPIIFMTAALTDVAGAMRGYQVGAVDFMMKPLDPDVVRAKVSVFVELYRRGEQIRKQGEQLQLAERRQRALELAELRRSVERRYNNLADSVPQLITRARADGEVEYLNRRFCEYTGTTFEQSSGSGWQRTLHPNDVERFIAQWQHAVTAGEPLRAEVRLRADGGAYRWFLCEGLPEREGGKTVVAYLASFTDVTDQKRVEEERAALLAREQTARVELERGLRRLDLLVEASRALGDSLDPATVLGHLAAIVVDRFATWCVIDRALPGGGFEQAAFAHVDAAFADGGAELGRGGVPDKDARIADLLAGGRAELATKSNAAELAQAIATVRVDLVERLGVASYISAPLLARGEILGAITFVSSGDRAYGPADLALGTDLAQRAALAIDNARLYAESQEATRLREEFLSIASHELRTPLSALQLQMQSLDANLKKPNFDPVKMQGKMAIAQRQVDRLTRLISELLDVSRIQAGRLELDREETDIVEVIRDVATRFAGEIERSSTPLELDLNGPIIGAFDRLRVDQIVTNLLHNAIKYGRGQPVMLSVSGDEESVRIAFADHGIGISPVDVQRIFGRFERAVSSRSYGGMGIGLFIVDQIVKAHGGEIHVSSELGCGSRFEVTLPRRFAGEAPASSGTEQRVDVDLPPAARVTMPSA
jgi:PAS domain S-box-containing protein